MTAIGHSMSITVAASGTSRTALVAGNLTGAANNFALTIILDGATALTGAGPGAVDANGNCTDTVVGPITIPGDNATHVIALAWTAVGNQNNVVVGGAALEVAS